MIQSEMLIDESLRHCTAPIQMLMLFTEDGHLLMSAVHAILNLFVRWNLKIYMHYLEHHYV